MRYKEQRVQNPKSSKKEPKPREMPKPGSYGQKDLGNPDKNWRGWDV